MCKMENSEAADTDKDDNGEGPQPRKIRRTLTSMINSMKMTEEEISYRTEHFDHVNIDEEYQTYLKCTKCDIEFQDKINRGEEVGIHPLLLVLMCDSCRDYYGDGNFSLDSEGEDKYCRWCGEGGTIFSCSKCICGFCDICIKKHFGEEELKRVESDDDWSCYFCNPRPLWDLRSICSLAWQASKTKKEQLGKITVKLRKRKKLRKSSEKDNDESLSSDSSYSIVNEKEGSKKRIKCAKSRSNCKRDSSSSSEDDKENSIKRKRPSRKKKKSLEKDMTESDLAVKKKLKVNSDPTFENKKTVVLNKLKSIWKLTQTIASVGLSLSRKRLKQLEQSDSFNNLEDLQAEHYDLKSFTTTLVSSLKSAASSIDSVKEDLSVDAATDETEIFRAQEREIKRLAKKLERKSNSEISTACDSDDSSKTESEEKANKSAQSARENQTEEKKVDEKSSGLSENSVSPCSDLKCDKVKENESKTNNESEKRENSEPRKPLLRVKAFARMLDENFLDKKKEKVVEVYDIESDKSGDECGSSLCDEKASKGEVIGKIESSDVSSKEPSNGTSAKMTRKNNKEKSKRKKENGEESTEKRAETERNENTWGIEAAGKEKKNDDCQSASKEKEGVVESKDGEKAEKSFSDNEVSNGRLVNKGRASLLNDKNSGKKITNDSKSEKKKQKSDEESSGGESMAAKRRKKNQNDSNSSGEELTVRKTRSRRKLIQTPVRGLFEKYKQKRENFIKSRKENLQNEKSKEGKPRNAELEDSEKEENHKKTKQKKKLVIVSSDEERENKSEKDDKSEEKIATSTDDESEVEVKKRRVGRKKTSDSGGEETQEGKKKRKDSSDSSEEEQNKRKGRRNIKKILKKDSLKVETKEALKNEEARRKRVKERQKLFEKLFPEDGGKIILDFDAEEKKPLVTIHKKLAKKLKPHQVKGVKFMWDNCFESVQRLEEDSGSGCILAHCMGLGKTLQVVALVHTIMTHDLGVNTVLIVCPLSTVSNWIREFESWLADINTEPIMLFDLVKYKKREERFFHLKDWHENGGVLVISYDLFRILAKTGTKKERKTKFKQTVVTALLDPGPDLVICDEGHLLKNEETALSKCMSQIKTSRRIVLTGTPLQNNLIEYHCMVQFVKPNILGTKKEFCNRFVNPINNGQFEDSTEFDVRIMKRRSHVLHSMLEGCIQRFDYSVLTPFLPEKHEYVVSISLTEKQAKAYQHFINFLSAKSKGTLKGRALFHDYHNLQRIWTHPRTLLMQSERETERELMKDEEDSLEDFIVSSGEETESEKSESSDSTKIQPRKRILRSNANDPDVIKAMEKEEEEEEEQQKTQARHWWDEFFDEETFDNLKESNKLILLFSLLKRCRKINDKILVFSQSLYSLDLIEYFLGEINDNDEMNNERLCGYSDTWHLGTDYFRLDGSTNSDQRTSWCKYFNEESNTRARLFLISTRAGGMGINLHGANRVVVFDASWNPSHDLQSIFRVYRFGQNKPCYIYRFLAEGTMEEKIYERQVTKLSLAHRVIDEHQIERHYTMGNLLELYEFKQAEEKSVPIVPKDTILADLLQEFRDIIVGYHEHDSLLENKEEEELTEEERKAAWKEYEEEKERKMTMDLNMQQQQQYLFQLQQAYPNVPVRVLNPAYVSMNLNQAFTNPMSNVPLDVLERGIRVGVAPLPLESADSFITRVLARESRMQ